MVFNDSEQRLSENRERAHETLKLGKKEKNYDNSSKDKEINNENMNKSKSRKNKKWPKNKKFGK